MTESEISYKIRGAIYAVYNTFGPGLLESVYQEALVYQLRKDGLEVKEQAPVPIIYDGHKLSADLHLDILVNETVIIELKSVSEMKALFSNKPSHKHLGILVNFNTDNINTSIHRILNGYL